MNKEFDIINLYFKERDYEIKVFGEYSDDKSLSFPSFLLFLKRYVDKAIEEYTGKWERELPPWLNSCIEFDNHGVAPVKAYEDVIKIMALAGAALETYAQINAEKWRENPEEDSKKWKD
jgi:hypothetical protein